MPDSRPYRPHYDAIIVGARCAGASTAMLLARAGARVLVVDRQRYGTDAVSTHALMRGGVMQLDRWGLLDRLLAAGTPPIRHTTFHYGEEEIRVGIKPEHGVAYLCAPRRDLLDRVLVDAAEEAGAEVRHGVTLTGLKLGLGGCVTGVELKRPDGAVVEVGADIVIGADGRQSKVARLIAARRYIEGTHSSGYVYGYFEDMADDGYHWYFEKDAAAGVIPTTGNRQCVFVGVPQGRFAETFRGNLNDGFHSVAAANSPALAAQVADAQRIGGLRGFAGGAGYLRQSHGPGWALVGDAGYFKDPLTAHGITDAFRDAELLSNAVLDGRPQSLARYQEERDALSMPLLEVTDRIASFDWDLEEIKDLHVRFSNSMKAEVNCVAGFSRVGATAA